MGFNRKAIMTRAWEIKRLFKNTIGEALKMSWAIAKKEVALKEYHCEPTGVVTFKLWAGYGKTRAYYTCDWRSNYANSKKDNFIEL